MSYSSVEQTYKKILKRLVSLTQRRSGEIKHISCDFCSKSITKKVHIECVVCRDLAICVTCFSNGREKEYHTRSHAYTVRDPLAFPLFMTGWTASEEVRLLEGLLKYGYGNWESISEFLEGERSAEELEGHYKQVYVQGDLLRHTLLSWRDEAGRICSTDVDNSQDFMQMDPQLPPLPIHRPEGTYHPLMEFASYQPRRGDFEIEYHNDMELYLAELDFTDNDSPEDRAIKLRQLVSNKQDIYNKVLDERDERKRFVIDRWPSEIKNEARFNDTVLRRNVYHAMKPFARFLTEEKHLELCEGLVKESILRYKLMELQAAKKEGVRTEEEFRQFIARYRQNFDSNTVFLSQDLYPTEAPGTISPAETAVQQNPENEEDLMIFLNMPHEQFRQMMNRVQENIAFIRSPEDIEPDLCKPQAALLERTAIYNYLQLRKAN